MRHPQAQKTLFDSLHQQHYPMVLQLCLGYMKGDSDLAKDITQEVFINIWNALDSFKGNATHKTWIYRITVNTCLLHIRSNIRKQTAPPNEASFEPESESMARKEDEHLALYKTIGELPELERVIIMLVLEDVEYEEIEKIVGINSVNLRVKIHRIKNKMRQLIKRDLNG